MLLRLRPSRYLLGWWLALHALSGLSLWLIHWQLGLIGLPLLGLHGVRRNPVRSELIVLSGSSCFGLPLQGRCKLQLAATSRRGRSWARLRFTDRPRCSLLVLRDQLDAPGWRRLVLAMREAN